MRPEPAIEQLVLQYRWIGADRRRVAAVRSLVSEAFSHAGEDGVKFVVGVINRVKFLTAPDYDNAIDVIADYIHDSFDLSQTILCASTANHEKDSGQKVLYDLTSALGMRGHYKLITSNRYDHAYREKSAATDLVLIDEFIGTGRSFLGRAKAIRNQFRQGAKPVPRIHGIALAGMSLGLHSIASNFDSLSVAISLARGIHQLAERSARNSEYVNNRTLEQQLQPVVGEFLLPSLGDGQCEALYSRHMGNCPNSVLPIFWWPQAINGQSRAVLFPRVM